MNNREAITLLRNLEDSLDSYCELNEEGKTAFRMAIEALNCSEFPNNSDTISRHAAIDAILAVTGNSSVRELYEHVQEHGLSDMWSGGVNAAIDIIIAVPSVQTESKETSSTHKALDTISRQAAIDSMCELMRHWFGCDSKDEIREIKRELGKLPSVQPEKRTEERTETHACDCISRQAAIDACIRVREYRAYDEIEEIKALPSAQPEPHWIPCSERLPEENGQYLITVKYVHVDGYDDIYAEHGEWTDGKWDMFCFGHCGKVENIIAWMPLPEPYRAERRTDDSD